MYSTLFLIACLALLTFIPLYRAAVGPTVADRLVAVNLICNLVIMMIVLLAVLAGAYYFLDVALVFILCSFISTVAIIKGLTWGKHS